MTDIITLGIRLDASGVVQGVSVGEQQFNKLGAAAQRSTEKVSAIEKGFGSLKTQILAFASVATALKIFHDLVNDSTQAEQSQKRLEGTLRATGRAAGLTAGELEDLATQMQNTTLVDDEKVKDAEAVLMSFRKIHGDTFRQAIKLSADLAFVMGGDLTGAALQVGKALADPVQGIGALGRAGVKLTDTQEQQIKNFMKINDLAGAQKVLIDALTSSFGGSAEGAHSGLTGSLHDVGVAYHELLETMGKRPPGPLLGWLTKGLNAAREALDDSPAANMRRRGDAASAEIGRIDQTIAFNAKHPGDAGVSTAELERRRVALAAVVAEVNAYFLATAKARQEDEKQARADGEKAASDQEKADKAAAAAAARAEQQKKIDELTKALQLEAGTLGMSAAEARVYELRLLGATDATIALAVANQKLIDSFDVLAEQHKARVARAIGGGNATQTSGSPADTGTNYIDPTKEYASDATDPNSGPNRRAAANAARLRAKAARDAEFFEAMWKRAAENSQDALADFFKNVGHGLDSVEDLFRSFVDTVIDMLAQIASANILGNSGGWFAKLIGGLLPGAIPGAPRIDTAVPEIPSLSAGMKASASASSMNVQQHIHFNVTAMDSKSVSKVLQEQAPTIMGIVGQAVADVPRAFGRRR